MAKVFLHFAFYSRIVCCCGGGGGGVVALCHDYDCISSCHYYLLFFASTFAPPAFSFVLFLHGPALSLLFSLFGFNFLFANPFKVEFNAWPAFVQLVVIPLLPTPSCRGCAFGTSV